MKILIVSDTHGRHKALEEILDKVQPVDMMIHLGDIEGGEDYIRAIADCDVHMVAGNNDFFTELDREEEFFIGPYRVLMTHGHYYYVSVGVDHIKQEAICRGVDIVMYGHTHKPFIEIGEEITVLNPGSVSFPRQEGRKSSFIIMEIDRNNEAHYTINYL
ncbi:metallophosphoesterase family protein [Lachnospiraceae bacterium LCP25S3_G4]